MNKTQTPHIARTPGFLQKLSRKEKREKGIHFNGIILKKTMRGHEISTVLPRCKEQPIEIYGYAS